MLQVGNRGVKSLVALTKLVSLNLSGCDYISDTCMPSLASMTQLQVLSLMWNAKRLKNGQPSGLTDRGDTLPAAATVLWRSMRGQNRHKTMRMSKFARSTGSVILLPLMRGSGVVPSMFGRRLALQVLAGQKKHAHLSELFLLLYS